MKNGIRTDRTSDQQQLPGFGGMVSEYQEGKDELNLAEFPIAALSNRVDQGTKTIVFEDSTRDNSTGEIIARSLTITASDAFGLPTASDDEVLLGLIQITRQQGFRKNRIHVRLRRFHCNDGRRWPVLERHGGVCRPYLDHGQHDRRARCRLLQIYRRAGHPPGLRLRGTPLPD